MLRINLLPDREKREGGRRFAVSTDRLPSVGDLRDAVADPWGLALVAVAAVVLLGVGWSWVSQASRADSLEEQIASATRDSARLAELMTASDSLRERRDEIDRRIQLVSRLDRGRYAWARTLHALASALPEPAWLTAVNAVRPLPDLRVRVEGEAASPLAVTAYARELEGFEWIRSARLQGTSRLTGGPAGGQSFTLVVDYGGLQAPGRGSAGAAGTGSDGTGSSGGGG